MKKSYRILQLQFYKGTHPSTYNLHVHTTLHIHPENSPSRIQFYMQKTESSSSTAFQKRNSTHRRQGDLLEIHPCVLQDIPGTPATSPYKGNSSYSSYSSYSRDIPVFQTFQAFQSFMTFQPFQAILQIQHCSSISRDSTPVQHSPIRMHILQFDWFPENSTEYQLNNYKHYILQRKGDVAILVKLTYSPE